MIKRDDVKWQYCGPQIPEVLFDAAGDPHETANLAVDSEYAGAVADEYGLRDFTSP